MMWFMAKVNETDTLHAGLNNTLNQVYVRISNITTGLVLSDAEWTLLSGKLAFSSWCFVLRVGFSFYISNHDWNILFVATLNNPSIFLFWGSCKSAKNWSSHFKWNTIFIILYCRSPFNHEFEFIMSIRMTIDLDTKFSNAFDDTKN